MRLLRRILRRLCAPYRCGLDGPLEVLISQLQVVLSGQGLSLRRITAELERQGIVSRAGRRLSPQLVANVLARQANGQG